MTTPSLVTAASTGAPAAAPRKVVALQIQDPKDTLGGGPDAQTVEMQQQMTRLFEHSIAAQAAASPAEKETGLSMLNASAGPEEPRWNVVNVGGAEVLQKAYPFKAFGGEKGEMKFANQVMQLAHITKHHPAMLVEFGRCTISYTTHDVGSQLHANDFLTAARTDGLLRTLPNLQQ